MARLRRSPALWLLLAAAVALAAHVAAEVFTVSSTADNGPGSLRDAIAQANARPGADEVIFDPALAGQPIVLTTDQLTVTDHLTLTGLGQDLLTIERAATAPAFRIFEIDDGTAAHIQVQLSGMKIVHGLAYSRPGSSEDALGGGLLNAEDLVIESTTLFGNTAQNTETGDNEDAFAFGGAIFNSGVLTLGNSTITVNSVSASCLAYCRAHGRGGGISNTDAGQVTLRNTTVTAWTYPDLVDSRLSSSS